MVYLLVVSAGAMALDMFRREAEAARRIVEIVDSNSPLPPTSVILLDQLTEDWGAHQIPTLTSAVQEKLKIFIRMIFETPEENRPDLPVEFVESRASRYFLEVPMARAEPSLWDIDARLIVLEAGDAHVRRFLEAGGDFPPQYLSYFLKLRRRFIALKEEAERDALRYIVPRQRMASHANQVAEFDRMIDTMLRYGANPLYTRDGFTLMVGQDDPDTSVSRRMFAAARNLDEERAQAYLEEWREVLSATAPSEWLPGDTVFNNLRQLGMPYTGSPSYESMRDPWPVSFGGMPWTVANHRFMGPDEQRVVVTVLLCAKRLQPALPIEIWLLIFEFLVARDFKAISH